MPHATGPFRDGLLRQLLGECSESTILPTINAALESSGGQLFDTVADAVEALHSEKLAHQTVDAVYRSALDAFRTTGDPTWRSFLLAGMLPGLEHLHFSLSVSTNQVQGMWEEVLFAFSLSLTSLSPAQRNSHIPFNLLQDPTLHFARHILGYLGGSIP